MGQFGDISGSSIYDGSFASNPITATAYTAAKAGGYKGTFEEYCATMAGLTQFYDDPEEFKALMSNLSAVKSAFKTEFTAKTITPTWEQGNIAVSTGQDQNSGNAYYPKRCRTDSYLRFDNVFGNSLTAIVDDNYELGVREYSDNAGTYNGPIPYGGNSMVTGTTEIPVFENCYYRFTLKQKTDTNFTPNDIPIKAVQFRYLRSPKTTSLFLNKLIAAFE